MIQAKPILQTTAGIQSLALMGRAVELVPRKWNGKRKYRPKKLVKGFVDISVGTALLGAQSNIINKL